MDINNELGICIKDLNKRVLFQNEICKKNCGELSSMICEKGCMENYHTFDGDVFSEGMHIIKNSKVDNHLSDAVVINNKKFLVTIFYPLEEKLKEVESRINDFKKFGLTNSELDILAFILKGSSNSEIAKKLFIAKSTLKTHLNNIYKKLPKSWHFLKERSK